jgi:hypothetical protein
VTLDDRFRVKGSGVTHEVIDDEAVIINLETGNYYSLDGAGAEIWTLLAAHARLTSIVDRLMQRYTGERSEMERALLVLIAELDREQLIAPYDPGAHALPLEPAVPAAAEARPAFEPPVLQKFTDMKELLLLDPIHEVDERGWPHRKPDGQP